jgi:multidrug transporter EmrE-like cation transporter
MSSEHGVDWIRGVTYSILASIIGGASKLSIRKSWLIAADLKRAALDSRVDSDEQDDIKGGDRSGFAHDSDRITPLEVAASSQTALVSNEEEVDYLYFNPSRETSPMIESSKHKKAISWALYLSGMIGMTFLNPLFCVLAMKYANPSILAPFSGLTLVWVVMFSGCVIGEPASARQRVACTLIILGQVIVAVFGDHTTKSNVSVQEIVSCDYCYRIQFKYLSFIGITLFCFYHWISFRSIRTKMLIL